MSHWVIPSGDNTAHNTSWGRIGCPTTTKNIFKMNGLVFLQTWSVDDFKKETGTVTLEVKRNPHTGKLFFAYGNEVGAVSDRLESGGFSSPVVSQVCSEDTGDTFFLLHQRGEGGCPTLARF